MGTSRAHELVRQLDHPRVEVRLAAADELVSLGADAEPALSEHLLRTEDVRVRRRMLLVLCEMLVPKAIPALMAYVLDRPAVSADDTRPLAMRALLASLEPQHRKHCFDFMVQTRRDADPMVRAAAVDGLAKLGDERGLRFLEEMASNDADETVKASARRALASFQVVALDAATAGGVYSEEELVHKLASRDAFQREMAISELLKNEHAFRHFSSAATCEHALARKSGIRGLGELGDAGARPLLLRIASDGKCDSDERSLALRALGNLPMEPGTVDGEALIAQLTSHLQQRDDVFRLAAALGTLARVPHPDALVRVAEFLQDAEPWVRESAAEAIAKAASPGQTALLGSIQDALEESGRRSQEVHEQTGHWSADETVIQRTLLYAAAKIAQGSDRHVSDLVPLATRFLPHPEASVRAAAAAYIDAAIQDARRSDSSELRALLEAANSRHADAQRVALAALDRGLPRGCAFAAPRLASLSYHDDAKVVLAVIPLLSRTNDPDAEQALARLVHDERANVAEAARAALMTTMRGEA